MAVRFIGGGNLEKTTVLSQVTDKLISHNVVSGFKLTMLVAIAQVVVNPTTIRSRP